MSCLMAAIIVSLDFSFFWFWYSHRLFAQAAIVAGIESGWVNPVINKEYAMEEVFIKSISSIPLIDYPTTKCSTILTSCTKFTTSVTSHSSIFTGPASALRHHPLEGGQGKAGPQGGWGVEERVVCTCWRRNQSKNFGGNTSSVTEGLSITIIPPSALVFLY